MLGQKTFTPKLFYQVHLGQLVPSDHELRRVLGLIDFEMIRAQVRDRYSHMGQPSIDPVVILKMLFLGYFYGIASERKLAKELIVNTAYRWFLGYDLDEAPPTHSVLSKARSRYGMEVFQAFFDRVVEQCQEAGLIGGKQVFLDYTLIDANAAEESLVPRMQVLTPREYTVQMMKEEEAVSPRADDRTPPGATTTKIHERMVSTTDPDATLTAYGTRAGLKYEGHYLVDGKRQVIVGVTTTNTVGNAGHEVPAFVQGALFRHGLQFETFCADAEYGTQRVYVFLEGQGITPYIPVAQSGQNLPKGFFLKSAFAYDAATDSYLCPAGERLERRYVDHIKQQIHYRTTAGRCPSCPLKSQCTSSRHGRLIKRLWYEELVQTARARMKTSEYGRQMKARRIVIEPLFSEAKECHGMRRAKYRRRWRVGIQVLWTATIQNIKRLMEETRQGPRRFLESRNVFGTPSLSDVMRLVISFFNCQRSLGWNGIS